MRKGIKIILIIALFPIAGITSQPFTERPVTPDKDKPFSDQISFCNTSSQYNDLTRATFYGDSRMDYAFQNPADMDFFLGASGQGWNVQNFGSSGETSEGLLTHLKSCLKYSNGQQYYQNYKIHQNIVYHIGGNDFGLPNVFGLLLKLMPWKFPSAVAQVANNNEKIVSIFHRRGKNVLLAGHYATVANSIKFGGRKNYFSGFTPGSKQGNPLDGSEINRTWGDQLIYNADPRSKLRKWFLENFPLSLTVPTITFSDLNLSPTLPSVGSYKWWVTVFADYASIASIGLFALEPKIMEMQERRSRYFNILHQPMWGNFSWAENLGEPYIANPVLMTDPVHPNTTGLYVWGTVIGNRLRELQWHNSAFSIVNQRFQPNINDDVSPDGEVLDSSAEPPPDNTGLLLLLCVLTGNCHL